MSFPGFKQLPSDAIGKARVAQVLTQQQYDEFMKTTRLKRVGECPLDGPPLIDKEPPSETLCISTELANTSLESK